jgi:hypothetical protein
MSATRDPHAVPRNPAEDPNHVHPARLTVWPMEEGFFGIDVRWHGRECALRAVTVRDLLVKSGFEAQLGHSLDGREWEVRIGPVPAADVARAIESFIW